MQIVLIKLQEPEISGRESCSLVELFGPKDRTLASLIRNIQTLVPCRSQTVLTSVIKIGRVPKSFVLS